MDEMPDIKDLESFYKASKKRYEDLNLDLIVIQNSKKKLKKLL